MNYTEFLKSKNKTIESCGFEPKNLNKKLFDFQKAIVSWSLKKGKSAIFADTGLGKGWMTLEWAKQVHDHTKGIVIIFAPLCVAKQFESEGSKMGIDVECVKSMPKENGVYSINYERMHEIDFSKLSGIVLDESSILKSHTGKTRTKLIENCQTIPFRLSCTATPSPNDFMELGNQSEFLGIMSRTEMLAQFFIHDGEETQKWRLKGHGKSVFWKWLSSWAIVIQKPEDIGFNQDGYDLPSLNFNIHKINTGKTLDGELFPIAAQTLGDRIKARSQTVSERVELAYQIINEQKESSWIAWCNLNTESSQLAKKLNAIEVSGSDDQDKKEKNLYDFSNEKIKTIVTKPSIAGFGMNWQHCNNMVFVGLNDSYEEIYQAIRRCYRFGQTKEVNVHFITSDLEGAILENIKRKEKQANEMRQEMIKFMSDFMKSEIKQTKRETNSYMEQELKTEFFTAYLGDCIEQSKKIESNSIGFSVFSPPFASLYTYSNSERDMGNSKNQDQFNNHFQFLIKELNRILMPGRSVAVHCMLLPSSIQNDGVIGLKDFRGDIIRAFQKEGFIFHSEVCIWKDPVIAMQRTKALGLLHKTIRTDSSMSRCGIPDYVVTMRKAGENPEPIEHSHEEFPVSLWQKIASPIWTDINQSDTLQFREARESDDERHICPLQLEVIERCLMLWSKKGDIVFSPFMGIGSEGYMAIKMKRKFIGVELKKSYYDLAIRNLKQAEESEEDLFSMVNAK